MQILYDESIFQVFDELRKVVMVHGCNCQGKYAAGFARLVRALYPAAYDSYVKCGQKTGYRLGRVDIAKIGESKFIVNGFTQRNYGRTPGVVYVEYRAVESVLTEAAQLAAKLDCPLLFPAIGCSLGGGDFDTITAIMHRATKDVDARLFMQRYR